MVPESRPDHAGADLAAQDVRETLIREAIIAHARELARTSRFCSWRMIHIELRHMRGIREAEACFRDTAFREELDALCRAAQSGEAPRRDLPFAIRRRRYASVAVPGASS